MSYRPIKRVEAATLGIKETRVLARVSEHVSDVLQTDPRARIPRISPRAETDAVQVRLEAKGKFLFAGDEKFYAKGVTYGAFRPNDKGQEYHDVQRIEADFAQMAANGFNAVRIPTPCHHVFFWTPRHAMVCVSWWACRRNSLLAI